MFNDANFEIPEPFQEALRTGKAVIDESGICRWVEEGEKVGEILGHLEPVTSLLENIPSSDPYLSLIKYSYKGYKLYQGKANQEKIKQIQTLIQKVEKISTISLGLSVVNLGVNVIGFSLVISRINEINKQMYEMKYLISDLYNDAKIRLIFDIEKEIRNSIRLIKKLEYNISNNWWERIIKSFSTTKQIESIIINEQIDLNLINIEVALDNLIVRYTSQNSINVPHGYRQNLYDYYANLLKVYLTSRYIQGSSLDYCVDQLETLDRMHSQLISENMLTNIYDEFLLQKQEIRLTPEELDDIFTLYRTKCKATKNAVFNHYEILKKTPIKKFRKWKIEVEKSQSPFMWINHKN